MCNFRSLGVHQAHKNLKESSNSSKLIRLDFLLDFCFPSDGFLLFLAALEILLLVLLDDEEDSMVAFLLDRLDSLESLFPV